MDQSDHAVGFVYFAARRTVGLRFVDLMRELLDNSTPLLATIARRGTGFIDEVKRHEDVDLFTVSGSNRDHLPEQLMMRLVGR